MYSINHNLTLPARPKKVRKDNDEECELHDHLCNVCMVDPPLMHGRSARVSCDQWLVHSSSLVVNDRDRGFITPQGPSLKPATVKSKQSH